MKRGLYFLCCIAVAILTHGCASGKNLVVLLPDNDGHIGEVDISNSAGTHSINRAWHASLVKNDATLPGASDPIEQERVDKLFGSALKALPDPPARHIVYFKPESAELAETAKAIVTEIIREIRARDSKDIGVVGYTDSMGTDDFNMKLSYRRAVCLKEILVSKGLNPEAIEVRYFGKSNPLIAVGDNVAEPRNRRVEIYVR